MPVHTEPAQGALPPKSTAPLRAWFHEIAAEYGSAILTLQIFASDRAGSRVHGAALARMYEVSAPAAAITIHRAMTALSPLEREVVLADLAAGGAALTRGLANRFGTTLNVIYVTRSHARAKLRRSVAESRSAHL